MQNLWGGGGGHFSKARINYGVYNELLEAQNLNFDSKCF